jgi:hypothetical protein
VAAHDDIPSSTLLPSTATTKHSRARNTAHNSVLLVGAFHFHQAQRTSQHPDSHQCPGPSHTHAISGRATGNAEDPGPFRTKYACVFRLSRSVKQDPFETVRHIIEERRKHLRISVGLAISLCALHVKRKADHRVATRDNRTWHRVVRFDWSEHQSVTLRQLAGFVGRTRLPFLHWVEPRRTGVRLLASWIN